MTKHVEGQCDCCGEWRLLQRCWTPGRFPIETFACAACRGEQEDEDEDDDVNG